MSTAFQLVNDPIAPAYCHAWNADRTQVAYATGAGEVRIDAFDGKEFKPLHVLREHSQRVTGIDWSPVTDHLVTCGEDRNAYVWVRQASGAWAPTLVILRINRAATCVKWSPNGKKFAVGSGSRLVSVCYFEEENDWWVSKHIKKPLRSTVTSIDWHPNNVLLAAGASDFKCRVFSGYIKSLDDKPPASVWGKKLPFAEVLAEAGPAEHTGVTGMGDAAEPAAGAAGAGKHSAAGAGGWVHGVSFSPSGERLAYVAHDSSVAVLDGPTKLARVLLKDLPCRAVTWVTENSLVAAGYDNVPYLLSYVDSALTVQGSLDVKTAKLARSMSAMDKFRSLDSKGTVDEAMTETSLSSTHQNAVLDMALFRGGKDAAQVLSTTGADGKLVLWDLAKAAAAAKITVA